MKVAPLVLERGNWWSFSYLPEEGRVQSVDMTNWAGHLTENQVNIRVAVSKEGWQGPKLTIWHILGVDESGLKVMRIFKQVKVGQIDDRQIRCLRSHKSTHVRGAKQMWKRMWTKKELWCESIKCEQKRNFQRGSSRCETCVQHRDFPLLCLMLRRTVFKWYWQIYAWFGNITTLKGGGQLVAKLARP